MTYYRLYQQARERNLKVQHDVLLHDASSEHCAELNVLEDYWVNSFDMSPKSDENISRDMTQCIEIRAAESRQAEVLHTATTVKRVSC
ncbi:MAG: hypothetical protein U5K84_11830 [Alkalibacterium sp.]|nr:hypothetical protein [Alkalibacterium sp.]